MSQGGQPPQPRLFCAINLHPTGTMTQVVDDTMTIGLPFAVTPAGQACDSVMTETGPPNA